MAAEQTFYVWVTTLTDSYTEQIVGRLVRRNWRIGSIGNALSLTSTENLATFMAFSMAKTPKDDKPENEITIAKALDEVKDVLKRLKIQYYSLVASVPAGCTWCLGNITQSELKSAEEERKKVTN